MINEKEIWYNKETHRTYLAEVVGVKLAVMQCIVLREIEGPGVVTCSGGRLNSVNLTINKDVQSIIPVDDRGKAKWWDKKWHMIGIAYPGACDTCPDRNYLDIQMIDVIKNWRAKDPNYKQEDLRAMLYPIKLEEKETTKDKPILQAKGATTKKVTPKRVVKKPVIKKRKK